MSRYRGPRFKIVRRLGRLPGLTHRRRGRIKPAVYTPRNTPARKASQYRLRSEEKQKLRLYYGLTEQQILRYVRTARRAKGSTGQVLSKLLESRLDNIVFRSGMAPTIPGARQLVTHKHILVNGGVISIPSYRCEPGDAITAGPGRTFIKGNDHLPPGNLTSGPQSTVYAAPRVKSAGGQSERKWVDPDVNELLVVEYYSRQA
uniref:Small ribosomal subunit protein uS4c n=1 Tax=Megaloselaginella exaltata TaxID=3140882 RepID=A0A7U3W300_9TRAC|nr:ribosomal protein S4 [Selaginella exaltata]